MLDYCGQGQNGTIIWCIAAVVNEEVVSTNAAFAVLFGEIASI